MPQGRNTKTQCTMSSRESMMLPQNLIAQYHTTIDTLRFAIENDDVDRIFELDREVSSLFSAIVNHNPEFEEGVEWL